MDIQEIIGYRFCDQNLLQQALVTPSYANDHKIESNDRLEFLGDRVLGLVVAERLYKQKGLRAGVMTDQMKAFVENAHLPICAERLGLVVAGGDKQYTCPFAKVSKPGFLSIKQVADLVESLIGAVYLDGGLHAAAKVVGKILVDKV
ncbi:MAG: ribonuclease III domain-containing protein [Firmicutes bacterium]|nr:ribonuclease III domain-containing protein [Bacillota bacterium]